MSHKSQTEKNYIVLYGKDRELEITNMFVVRKNIFLTFCKQSIKLFMN